MNRQLKVLTFAATIAAAIVAAAGLAACDRPKPEPVKVAPAAASTKADDDAAKVKQAAKIAQDAYVYGYPLVTMELTRRVLTNVAEPAGKAAPMGQFIKLRQYPGPQDRAVTAPNADTLYTIVWLDVSKEPWVVSMPDMKGRYYMMPMLSGWTDVFSVPGTRTTGSGPQAVAITGPGFAGALPAGVKEVKSPTAIVWMLGRIYSSGTAADFKAVHALQDKFSAVPLSAYGKPYTPPIEKSDPSIDMKTAVRDQVNQLDAAAYFGLLASLMKDNPPAAADAPMLADMANIGIAPGQPFDLGKLDPAVQAVVKTAPGEALKRIIGWRKLAPSVGDAKVQNGWSFPTKAGLYGTNYIQRALITYFGLGANLPQDAIYPTTQATADGADYDGANRYVMTFKKGEMPPAEAFWSITMYDDQYFFTPNALNRVTLSSRDKFKTNADGSIDLYFSSESPGKNKEANWLPAPKGKFILMLRMYQPREKPPSILDGSWKVPAVRKDS